MTGADQYHDTPGGRTRPTFAELTRLVWVPFVVKEWDQIIVVCDWGCCMMSCVDCSDDDFNVYRWDGNAFDDATDLENPSDELWTIESDTFNEWVLTPNVTWSAT